MMSEELSAALFSWFVEFCDRTTPVRHSAHRIVSR